MRTRMNHLSLIRLAAVALTLAVLTGCADLQEQLPPATTAGANVHPDGWNVPAASTFHGKHIRANGWEMTSCQQCHGALNSTNGGTSGVSCATCHSQPAGPNDCTTCHGGVNAAPPRDLDGTTTVTSPGVGAHQFHLASMTTGKLVQCAECHTVPAATADSGHIDASLPAEAATARSRTATSRTPQRGTRPPVPAPRAAPATATQRPRRPRRRRCQRRPRAAARIPTTRSACGATIRPSMRVPRSSTLRSTSTARSRSIRTAARSAAAIVTARRTLRPPSTLRATPTGRPRALARTRSTAPAERSARRWRAPSVTSARVGSITRAPTGIWTAPRTPNWSSVRWRERTRWA